MHKYIFALIFTLLSLTQIEAQHKDLRSAPTPPTFQVTLNYSVSGGGATVTAMLANGVKVPDGGTVMLGSTVHLSVVMDNDCKLTGVTVSDGQNTPEDVTIPSPTTTTDGKLSYMFSQKMEKHTEFVFTTNQSGRSTIQVDDLIIDWLKQKLGTDIMPILVNPRDKTKLPGVNPWDFKTLYDYSGTGNYEPFDKTKFTHAGDYPIMITRPEDSNYNAFSTTATMHIIGETVRVEYRVDAINGGNWQITAKVGNENFVSGFDVEVGSKIDFALQTESGYGLTKIIFNGTDAITDFEGKCENGGNTYTYTTEAITEACAYRFYVERKKKLEGLKYENLTQTEGALKPVVATFVPDGISDFTVKYYLDGEWTEKLDPDLKAGTYDVEITREEDLTYQKFSEKKQLVIIAGGQPTEPTEPGKIALTYILFPNPGTIIEGQPLSVCTLTGGAAKAGEVDVEGSFVWKNPNTTASSDVESYAFVFIPTNSAYASMELEMTLKVTPVYTVTTSSNPFGHIIYKTVQNADNRYVKGSVIQLEAIAEPNYKFSGWNDGVKTATRSLTVDKNIELYAQFDSILYQVAVEEPTNGKLTVTANGQTITKPTYLLQGTLLSITATPEANYQVDKVTVNGALINSGSYVMEADATVAATFSEKPATTSLVNVSALAHGKVTLIANDAPITPGTAVEKNTVVTVNATPDNGYILPTDGITATGTTLNGNTFTVGDNDVTLSVVFKPEQYDLSTTAMASQGEITLERVTESGKETFSDAKADYLTKLIVTLTHKNADYRFINMTANTASIQSGDTVTVTGPLTISANYAQKIDLTQLIMAVQQEYTYADIERSFEVRVQGYSGLSFDVTYQQDNNQVKPINAGYYDVVISRKADDLFKAVNLFIADGLYIKKAKMALKKAPTIGADGSVSDIELTQEVKGLAWNPESSSLKSAKFSLRSDVSVTGDTQDGKVNILRFTPVSDNYEPLDYFVPIGDVEKVAVFLNGTKAYNGGLEVQSGSQVPVGTVLTLEPIIIPGMRFSEWKETKTADLTVEIKKEESFTAMLSMLKNITVTNEALIATYNGRVQPISNPFVGDAPEGIVIRYLNSDGVAATPLNASTYRVSIYYPGDDEYAEFKEELGYTIKPLETTIAEADKPTATPLYKGQTLANSVLAGGIAKAGGTTVAGAFTWETPSTIVSDANNTQKVTFVSYDPNYSNTKTSVTVQVTEPATPIISFAQPENGTLTVKLADGSEISSGTALSKDAKITVAVTPNVGYELEKLTIGNTDYSSAPQTVTVNGSLTITATLKQKQSEGGGSDVPVYPSEPETIPNPVVAERTATTAFITWEKIDGATGYKLNLYQKKGDAMPLKTYEFDASGNLKATGISFTLTGLTEGQSYYVETVAITPNGEIKRGIELAGTPTGIEAIAEGSQLYTVKGAIVIVPTAPLEVTIISVTGRPVFHDEVSGYTQVTSNAGVYVVVLRNGTNQVVEKVLVR